MVDGDDVTLVHADEAVGWQNLLQCLQGIERRDAFLLGVERYIFVLPLDVEEAPYGFTAWLIAS